MIIAITGPIAAGKDLVLNLLQDKLNPEIILDADKIGKFIVENNFYKISNIFNIKDLTELSNLVFNDFSKFLEYNSFIHPILASKLRKILLNIILSSSILSFPTLDNKTGLIKNLIKNKNLDYKITIVNCALLYLFRLDFFCDIILFVDSDKEIRVKRIMERNCLTYNDSKKRVEFQENVENYERIREIFKIKSFSKYIPAKDISMKNILKNDILKNGQYKFSPEIYYITNNDDIENLKMKIDYFLQIYNIF